MSDHGEESVTDTAPSPAIQLNGDSTDKPVESSPKSVNGVQHDTSENASSKYRHRTIRMSRGESASRSPRRPPLRKVVHKIEYRHVSSNNIVWEEESDRFAPSKTPPEEPVLEVITIAFTAQDRSPYHYQGAALKAPPIHSMGEKYIQINSAAVVNALRAVVEYCPGQNLIGDSITISEPYTILVHHEKELAAYRENFAPGKNEDSKEDPEPCEVEEDTYEHLGLVLKFVQQTLKL